MYKRDIKLFLEFTNVSADKTADALFKHKIDMKEKLIAQTCDSAAITTGHFNGL